MTATTPQGLLFGFLLLGGEGESFVVERELQLLGADRNDTRFDRRTYESLVRYVTMTNPREENANLPFCGF